MEILHLIERMLSEYQPAESRWSTDVAENTTVVGKRVVLLLGVFDDLGRLHDYLHLRPEIARKRA